MTLWESVESALGGGPVEFGKFLHGRLDGESLARVGWKSVDQLIATSTLEHGLVRVVPNQDIDAATYIETSMGGGEIVERRPRRKAFLELLQQGATLVVNKAERATPALRDVVEGLEYSQGEVAWANGYACWATSSAFGRHGDSHDTIIVQVEGKKHWRVYEGSGKNAGLVFDAVLERGDVLHVPLGWDHEVTGVGGESLHWTFGIARTAPVEVVRELLRFGMPLDEVVGLHDEERYSRLLQIRRELSPERRRGMSLPWAVRQVDLDGTCFRWAGRYSPIVNSQDERNQIRGLGKSVTLRSEFRSVLDSWADGDRTSYQSLLDSVELPMAEVNAVLQSLLQAGLVIAEHDDAD